jgi:hypothetical protein
MTVGVVEGAVEVTARDGTSMVVAAARSVHLSDGAGFSTQVAGVVLTGDPAIDQGIPISIARAAPALWQHSSQDQPGSGRPRMDILPAGEDEPKGEEEPDGD